LTKNSRFPAVSKPEGRKKRMAMTSAEKHQKKEKSLSHKMEDEKEKKGKRAQGVLTDFMT